MNVSRLTDKCGTHVGFRFGFRVKLSGVEQRWAVIEMSGPLNVKEPKRELKIRGESLKSKIKVDG